MSRYVRADPVVARGDVDIVVSGIFLIFAILLVVPERKAENFTHRLPELQLWWGRARKTARRAFVASDVPTGSSVCRICALSCDNDVFQRP
ncbi:hypothetical protein [Streptomyces sp. NPDC051014]|uniref:hypothetical protein n=1 Tax=Streptomyces sp. NPDC051014 TaxID=3155751 RepID=UPI0033DB82A1